jgi:hypothetical protein
VIDDDDEVIGKPSFELRLRDGEPQVSGCYFMHPVLQVADFAWAGADRILVTADDGSRWYADRVPRQGVASATLHRLTD